MARRRFVAPSREAIDPGCFDAPIFSGFASRRDWWLGPEWPTLEALNVALGGIVHPQSGVPLRFVAQDAALLSDGLHYEQRIHARGEIATRPRNWHDLFNAAVWCAWPRLKAAFNTRQAADVAQVGPAERTRAQCALTHFDEAGAIVLLRDARLLEHWDAHDWQGLFSREREAWRDGRAEVTLIGHALLEHALAPTPVHTAKCVVVLDESNGKSTSTGSDAVGRLAAAISSGVALNDPQELRPLPLSGIPGWHPRTVDVDFYTRGECFRPLRPGRIYPPALVMSLVSSQGGQPPIRWSAREPMRPAKACAIGSSKNA